MQQPVTCDTLGALDNGSARAIINRAILEAVTDLDDRAADDDKPRKVVIELTFERRKNSDVEVSVEAIAKVPKRRTASTVATLRLADNGSQLQFNDLATDDPSQRTIDERIKDKSRREKRTAESDGE